MRIVPVTQYVGLEVRGGQLHEAERHMLDELKVEALPYDHLYDGQPSYNRADLSRVQPAAVAMRGAGTNVGGFDRVGLRVGTLAITSFEVQSTGPLSLSVTAATARVYHQPLASEAPTTAHPEWFAGFDVWWGDGADSDTTDPGMDGLQSNLSHTYAAAGDYEVELILYLASNLTFAWDRYPRATRQITVS